MEEQDYIKEQQYLQAKKRVKDIKGFYVHLTVQIASMVIIIAVNLIFVPHYHFFWFALMGISIALFFHWLGVFGFSRFGKEWEKRKIQELMDKEKQHK